DCDTATVIPAEAGIQILVPSSAWERTPPEGLLRHRLTKRCYQQAVAARVWKQHQDLAPWPKLQLRRHVSLCSASWQLAPRHLKLPLEGKVRQPGSGTYS